MVVASLQQALACHLARLSLYIPNRKCRLSVFFAAVHITKDSAYVRHYKPQHNPHYKAETLHLMFLCIYCFHDVVSCLRGKLVLETFIQPTSVLLSPQW